MASVCPAWPSVYKMLSGSSLGQREKSLVFKGLYMVQTASFPAASGPH